VSKYVNKYYFNSCSNCYLKHEVEQVFFFSSIRQTCVNKTQYIRGTKVNIICKQNYIIQEFENNNNWES